MVPDHCPLRRVQFSGLVQNDGRDADLPDIVKDRPYSQNIQRPDRKPQIYFLYDRRFGDSFEMAFGRAFFGVNGICQGGKNALHTLQIAPEAFGTDE